MVAMRGRTQIPPIFTSSDALCGPPLTDVPLTAADAMALASVLAALADPVRLRLLSILAAQGEVCSCHLTGPLG
jgi:ArsR family transcriptional regulator